MDENRKCKNLINKRNIFNINNANIDYLCLFSSVSHVWYGRFFKNNYKHCLIIVRCGHGWIFLDSLRSGLVKAYLGNVDADELAAVYVKIGYKVVYGKRVNKTTNDLGKSHTCVGVCKRMIRLSVPHVVTPFQLKKYLIKYSYGVFYEKS